MKHRVFIAIDLPDDLKELIVQAQDKMNKFNWPVRWEPIEKLHITLRFLGNITNEDIAIVQDIVHAEIQKTQAFPLTLDGYVFFPTSKYPTVLCLLVVDNTVLYTFQRALADALAEVQLGEPERHSFNGHITIGRTKPMSVPYNALSQVKFKHQCECNSVSIYCSELLESGSRYTIINTYQCAHPRN